MKDKDNFDYTVVSREDFDSTVVELQKEIEKNGMRVLHIHDVQATLAQKGLAHEPFKMIEFCKADYAHTLLGINPRVGIFLPCKISVYIQGEETFISVLNLNSITSLFSDATVISLLSEVNDIVKKIVDSLRAN